ncbi:Uncharacterised protein [Burkholderia pseudomallei]|uniref:Uncharacterized protein n=1 Tax=Burkholderia cenocepacia TaxID=95486 RepID=A0A3S9N830_9BURK|nr:MULTISPECIES: hypothetical protein [Burkholderia]AZQ51731.1 hypothetical protein D5R55_12370 [Burkholderia cenocepacia]CAJ2718946.1 Uncharacterised protein [Burkholderia pseudomallei]VCA66443.1 Uncharacterised protein [Burkholderia pseudomallei]VCA70771.1 Uncharacterised protein [Burkholderia pseudomallei]VCA73079.1 Uncharacterised protein [Burkholderia pseudomallei]
MQLVRLNGTQRAALSGTEIDSRPFVEVDLFHTQPDGTETFMRVLLSHERAAALAEALLAARDDVEPARLERSNG